MYPAPRLSMMIMLRMIDFLHCRAGFFSDFQGAICFHLSKCASAHGLAIKEIYAGTRLQMRGTDAADDARVFGQFFARADQLRFIAKRDFVHDQLPLSWSRDGPGRGQVGSIKSDPMIQIL